MVRILGNNLAEQKKIYLALTCIYGIGISKSLEILDKLKIKSDKKVFELKEKEIFLLRNTLEHGALALEGNLKRQIGLNIRHLININCTRGKRHLKGLPVHGQRTRTNSRTSRKQNIFVISK